MAFCEVIEEFKFSPDGRETIVYELGKYEIVSANPRPNQVTTLCAEYAARKGYALKEGTTNIFEVENAPLDKPATKVAPRTVAKGKKKS